MPQKANHPRVVGCMPRRPPQRPLLLWLRWLVLWSLRLIKIALVGLTTCGLAMFLYYERFKQRRLPASKERRR